VLGRPGWIQQCHLAETTERGRTETELLLGVALERALPPLAIAFLAVPPRRHTPPALHREVRMAINGKCMFLN
jgi:hypothetical protein